MQKVARPKMLVCYVRHGQTDDNVAGIIAGHQPGKLTKTGIQQAFQTGLALKDATFDFIYVSDLNRTRETYESLLTRAPHLEDIKVEYTPLIREKLGGVLQGKRITTWKENADKEKKNIRVYKCLKGESWEDVYQRSHKFVHTLIRNHLKPTGNLPLGDLKVGDKEGKEREAVKILVVTHGGFIMETHNLMNWLSAKKQPVFLNIAKNCSFHQFQICYKGEDLEEIDDALVEVECVKNNITHY